MENPVLLSKIAHIQRVIMGQNFHIRQELNRYSDMVEEQRRLLYEERLGILKGETAMSPSEQRVRLYYMDKLWADHLAFVSYIRESIHLTSLTNRNPIDEFHMQIIQAYEELPDKIMRESANMLSKLGDSNNPALWEKFGLKTPTSTWTYTMNDQYMEYSQNPGSWSPGTVIAFWLRKILRPVFG